MATRREEEEAGGNFGAILDAFERQQQGRQGERPGGPRPKKRPTVAPESPAPLDEDDFGAVLAAFEAEQIDAGAEPQRKVPAPGERVTGTVAAIADEVVFVDLGAKAEGVVERLELTDDEGELTVRVGDTVTGVVSGTDGSGTLTLRVRPGRGQAMRAELRLAYEQKLPVEGVVAGVVKGGVEVTVAGVRAFCPVSQLADRYVEDPAEFVGQRLEFRIERLEDAGPRTNVVLSRRALLAAEAARRAEAVRDKLKVGAVLRGKVTSVTTYGAFVDLGGLEGLLHVSELSHQRVEDPHELVAEGQELEVQVTKVEPPKKPGQSERISLSIRALQRDPWKDAVHRYPAATVVQGRVMRLEPYGAFVELAPGVEGLIHVSQLGRDEHVRHAREVLQLGQDVRAEVLGVDPDKRRISLALKPSEQDLAAAREVEEYLDKGQSTGAFGSLGDFFKKSRK